MEKYFKSYGDAADYVIKNVLSKFEKKVIHIEKLQMDNEDFFYKLTVEPYEVNISTVKPYEGITNSHPWIITPTPVITDVPTPLVWHDTKYTGYKINWGKGDTTGDNPYQE